MAEGGEGKEGGKSYDHMKAWSPIYHSIFSGVPYWSPPRPIYTRQHSFVALMAFDILNLPAVNGSIPLHASSYMYFNAFFTCYTKRKIEGRKVVYGFMG